MHATHETPTRARTSDRDADWLDQYLEFVRRIEGPMVRTTARVASRVAEYVPERPAFLARMPKVHEMIDTGITVRTRMVDEQTRFARQLVTAMDPMLARVDTVHTGTTHAGTTHAGTTHAGTTHAETRHADKTPAGAAQPTRRRVPQGAASTRRRADTTTPRTTRAGTRSPAASGRRVGPQRPARPLAMDAPATTAD